MYRFDIKGLFALLFAEIFWMLSVAFFLSLAVTEITLSLAYTYIRPEDMISFSLVDLYGSQLGLYLVLLLICMLAILYPIYRLRRLSVLHSVVQRQKRHVFRNFMIALQLAISILFTGGVFGITLLFDEMFEGMYHPLSTEEENRMISISVNTIRMQKNMDAILSDISPCRNNRSDIRFQYLRCRCLYLHDLHEKRKAERKCADEPSRTPLF